MTGAPENPELGVECRRCSALSAAERKQLRDRAMTRDIERELNGPTVDDDNRARR